MKRGVLMDLLEKIQAYQENATHSEKKLIDNILANPNNVIGYTSKDLAHKLSISNSTITRFCQKLGFKGYIEFSKNIFEEQKNKPIEIENSNQVQKLNNVMRSLDEINNTLFNVLNSDIINLTETFKTFNPQKFQNIAEVLSESETIYIIGFSSCKIVASFIHFHLDRIGFNVELITHCGAELTQRLGKPNQKQSIFLVSFPRYSKDSKLVTKLSHLLKIPLIVMTDQENHLTENAQHTILVKTDNNHTFYNSMVAPMAVANAFITTCSMYNPERTKKYLDYTIKKFKITSSVF